MSDIRIVLDAFTSDKGLDSAIAKLESVVTLQDKIAANKAALIDAKSPIETAKLTEETRRLVAERQKLIEAERQLTVEGQKLKLQNEEARRIAKSQAKEELGLVDAYQKLNNQYREAVRNAKNLAIQQGINSKAARQAALEATKLGDQLKRIDANVGQFQRNVGNYENSMVKGFGRVFQSMKTIANIIPGLGISGIFLLGYEAILNAVQAMGFFKDETQQSSKAMEDLNAEFINLQTSIDNLSLGNLELAGKLTKEGAGQLKAQLELEQRLDKIQEQRLARFKELQEQFGFEQGDIKLNADGLAQSVKTDFLTQSGKESFLEDLRALNNELTKERNKYNIQEQAAEEEYRLKIEKLRLDKEKETGRKLKTVRKKSLKESHKEEIDLWAEAIREQERLAAEADREGRNTLKKRLDESQRIRESREKIATLSSREGSYQRLLTDISIIETERDVILSNAHLTEVERQAIIMESEEKIRKTRQEFINKQIEDIQRSSAIIFNILDQQQQIKADNIQNDIKNTDIALKRQQELADAGQRNTLAFEEKRKAELEKTRIDQQRKQQRTKEIEAFFNAFAEYAKEDPKTALFKAGRDIALAKLAAQAFAEDGGIVGDIAEPISGGRIANGIFKGRSHKQGGILLEAEGEEGIFSKKEMRNLGRDNFYSIKDMLKNPINDDIFERQNAGFIQAIPIAVEAKNDELIAEIKDLKQVIKNKREFYIDYDKQANMIVTKIENGIKEVTEKRMRKPRI